MNQSPKTREQLLATARSLFAERGYDGSSVRTITAAAGANLGAVGYHFGSKAGLYHAVLAAAWAGVGAEVQREGGREAPALDRIEAILRALFAALADEPDVGGLILHVLADARPVPEPVRAQVQLLAQTLERALAEGQAAGQIVAGDPQLLILSILAQPFHALAVRNKLREVLGLPADDAAVFARVVDNAVAFARRGLAAEGRAG